MPLADGLIRSALGQWLVEGDQGVSRLVGEAGHFLYESNLRDLCAVAFCIPEGGVVVDAGACIGDQTVPYAQMVGVTGLVHAFEPHPASYRALVRNTAFLTNVRTHPTALGDHFYEEPLSLTPSNIGASFLGVSPVFDFVEVDVTTLDAALEDCQRLDFIHLDAEGMESKILDGAKTLIAKFQPAMMIEVTDQWLRRYGSSAIALMQQLAQMGYSTLVKMQPNAAQFDVVALPASRLHLNQELTSAEILGTSA
jgi:FkbM family methyltransferase